MVIMVPFKYRDFYDVPRLIVLKYNGHLIMLGTSLHCCDISPDRFCEPQN